MRVLNVLLVFWAISGYGLVEAGTLRWRPMADTETYVVVGYKVHLFETSSGGVEQVIDVGKVTEFDLDDYLDSKGYEEGAYCFAISVYTTEGANSLLSSPVPYLYKKKKKKAHNAIQKE